MTKFILHGGQTRVPNEHNANFYREWVKDFKDDFVPTILLAYFSREPHEWPVLEKEDKERFAEHTNNRDANFIVADGDLSVFKDQVKKADVVYFRGGSESLIKKNLLLIKDELLDLLKDKVYAGSSAGVMVLSHFTRSHETDWTEGLGLLPINSIVHWAPNLQDSLDKFNKEHPNESREMLLLPETEFVVRSY